MTFATLDQSEADALARLIRPARRKRSFLGFCRTVKLPDGPKQGEYLRPESEPAQLRFIQAITSGKYRMFVHAAPSQRGKTLIAILIAWLYSIVEESLSVGYVMPNLDKLSQNWEGKIKPAIVGSGYGSWLPSKGPGSKGGRPAALLLVDPDTKRSAVTYFMAGGTGARETSLSSVSPARLLVDEVDDFESAGHVDLALKRLESWGSKALAFLASTVNTRSNRESHPILDFFSRQDATRSRICHKCPHCCKYQILSLDQLNLQTGQISCSHCGVIWSEDDRNKALDDSGIVHGEENLKLGVILDDERHSAIFSLLTTGFDYHMSNLLTIAQTYQVAKEKEALGDYSMMENFSHKVLCVPYTIPVDHETITDRLLTLRSAKSQWERGIVPDEADRIVVTIDVQGDRCYWLAMAGGLNDRRWIIDWDEWFWTSKDEHTGKPLEPTDIDRHIILDRVLAKARDGWPRLNGNVVKASALGIDIGYNVGGTIGRWARGKSGVVAMRGDSQDRQIIETLDGKHTSLKFSRTGSFLEADHGFYEIRKQEVALDQSPYWWFVKTQSLREHLAGRIRREVESEGSLMLPHGVAEKDFLIKHLSSWAIVRDQDTKMVKWVQIGKRDDYMDTACYGLALLTTKPKKTGGNVGKVG
jgi:phage terminase large subunit GpA-like protein